MIKITNQDLRNSHIVIVSGEGTVGFQELFRGKKTLRAIKQKLKKEARDGRWAYALMDLVDDSYQYKMTPEGLVE